MSQPCTRCVHSLRALHAAIFNWGPRIDAEKIDNRISDIAHSATAKISWLSEADRLGDQTHPENRLAGRIEQFHPPLGILLQAMCDAAEQIGANAPHLAPRCLMAFELDALYRSAGITALTDTEKVLRHVHARP